MPQKQSRIISKIVFKKNLYATHFHATENYVLICHRRLNFSLSTSLPPPSPPPPLSPLPHLREDESSRSGGIRAPPQTVTPLSPDGSGAGTATRAPAGSGGNSRPVPARRSVGEVRSCGGAVRSPRDLENPPRRTSSARPTAGRGFPWERSKCSVA